MGTCEGYRKVEREVGYREMARLWWILGTFLFLAAAFDLVQTLTAVQGSTLSLAYAQVGDLPFSCVQIWFKLNQHILSKSHPDRVKSLVLR
jgi:hypothetical protein